MFDAIPLERHATGVVVKGLALALFIHIYIDTLKS